MALIETYYGPNGHFEPEKGNFKYGPEDKENLFTADSFLNFIRRSNPVWYEGDTIPDEQQWVYRGHWNSNWPLIPSAARELKYNPLADIIKSKQNAFEKNGSIEVNQKIACYLHACHIIYYNFYKIARYEGKIGGGWGYVELQSIDKIFDQIQSKEFCVNEELPANNLIEYIQKLTGLSSDISCLAQHSGLPTYLLDWSFDSLISSYFATTSNNKHLDKHDICVWAFNKHENKSTRGQLSSSLDLGRISTYRPPARDNENLKAQDGLLIYIEDDRDIFLETGNYPTFSEIISKWTNSEIKNKSDFDENEIPNSNCNKLTLLEEIERPILRKVVLDKHQVPKLRKMLKLEGISRSKLFPNYINMAKDAIDLSLPE